MCRANRIVHVRVTNDLHFKVRMLLSRLVALLARSGLSASTCLCFWIVIFMALGFDELLWHFSSKPLDEEPTSTYVLLYT